MAEPVSGMVSEFRTRAKIPDGMLSDAEILTYLNAAIQEQIIPAILKAREGYFEVTSDVTLTANQRVIPVPADAIGQKVVLLSYSQSGANDNHSRLGMVTANQEASPRGHSAGFRLSGANIVLTFDPPAGANLRILYLARPAPLTLVGDFVGLPPDFRGVVIRGALVMFFEPDGGKALNAAQAKFGEALGAAMEYITPRAEQHTLSHNARDSVFFTGRSPWRW